jgi:glyoxylase-like metal-dependent hydrolase (beta-lactamase superfamily II)
VIVYRNDDWLIERIVVGDLMVNCYLVVDRPTGQAIVVDPGDEGARIIAKAFKLNARSTAIVITHGHGDHIGGNQLLAGRLDVPIMVGRLDAPMLPDAWMNLSAPFGMSVVSPPAARLLDEGDVVGVGGKELKVLHTPGHSPGSICLVGEGFSIVGDLIFQGSVGRTDFPGGSFAELKRMILEKIFPLGDDCLLLPGHGDTTTVGVERRTNPFLQPGFDGEFD